MENELEKILEHKRETEMMWGLTGMFQSVHVGLRENVAEIIPKS